VHQQIAALVDRASDCQDIINRFYYCPYHPDAPLDEYRRDHPWRKPHPGMLLQAARDMNLDLTRCWMVGDQRRDVEAGRSAGCRTVLVTPDTQLASEAKPTVSAGSFAEAVENILREVPDGGDEEPPSKAGATPAAPPAAPAATPAAAPPRTDAGAGSDDLRGLRRAIGELTDELRTEQQRRVEFTGFRLAAGMCQLFALLLALLGLLQLGTADVFMKWMIGAVLVQLLTIAILLLDLKG
jgi:hypothetical protein